MKQRHRTTRSRKGMAMLMVLFIVMAIAVISSGFIARSDTALACGRNFNVHNEVDYAAWGGLEVAWALVQDPNVVSYDETEQSADWGAESNSLKYDLVIDSGVATADPNVYTHAVTCQAYKSVNGQRQATSALYGDLIHDTDSGAAYYISIRRQE